MRSSSGYPTVEKQNKTKQKTQSHTSMRLKVWRKLLNNWTPDEHKLPTVKFCKREVWHGKSECGQNPTETLAEQKLAEQRVGGEDSHKQRKQHVQRPGVSREQHVQRPSVSQFQGLKKLTRGSRNWGGLSGVNLPWEKRKTTWSWRRNFIL